MTRDSRIAAALALIGTPRERCATCDRVLGVPVRCVDRHSVRSAAMACDIDAQAVYRAYRKTKAQSSPA